MARLFRLLIYVIVIIAGLLFAVFNANPVEFNYYFGRVQWPLAFLLTLSALCGALLGVIASFGMVLRSKRKLSAVHKALSVAEKELANLRSLPLKDAP